MRRKCILAGTVVLCLLCSLGLQAQQADSSASDNTNLSASSQPPAGAVPRLIKFTGAVKDLTGKVPTGVVGLTFALYELPEGGSPLWVETQSLSLDALGRYTALLGANSPEGLPLDLFTSGKALWVGVQPQLPGQPEQPRVLLVAVPYALKSSDADTLGGLPASAYMLSPNANTAQGNSATPLITVPPPCVDGTTAGPSAVGLPCPVTPTPSTAITGGGTANFAAMFTGASTIGNSSIYNSPGGKVGIGTTNPAATLDVHGTGNFSGALTAAGMALPATGTATATQGFASNPFDSIASSFNSGTSAAVPQLFRWKAEPAANNTASPSGTLNLLYLSGAGTPAETGLSIASNGQINFASGQTFPGTGTGSVTSVGSGAGLTGGPITTSGTLSIATGGVTNSMMANSSLSVLPGTDLVGGGPVPLGGSVTLNLDTTKVPTLAAGSNIFTGSITASSFSGSGSGLTNVNAATLGGSAASAFQPAGSYATLGAGTNTFTGSITATSFTGNGTGLTNLTAANLSAGTAGINITGNAATATTAASATTATTASNAQSLGGVTATDYARLDIGNSFTGNQSVSGNVSATGSVSGGTASFTGALSGTSATFSGTLTAAGAAFPATGAATSSKGYNSNPLDLMASAFNGTSAISPDFRWVAEPANNNSSNASATLNLQFGANGATPSETGLSIAPNGLITFAPSQTFPGGGGGGTITGVTAGPGLSGGGTSGNVTLTNTGLLGLTTGTGITTSGGQAPTVGIDTTVVPLLGTANNFTGNQTVATNVGIGTTTPAALLDVEGATAPNGANAVPALQIVGGAGGSGNRQGGGGTGGAMTLSAGAGGGSSEGVNYEYGGGGGAISLSGGLNIAGGPISLTAGAGGYSTAVGGQGGAINLTAGAGGTGEYNTGGNGGAITLQPGLAGGGTEYHGYNGNLLLAPSGGMVGIATNSPTATLEVNGTTKFDQPVTFASGQTFPGTGGGTITGVAAGTDLTGGGASGSVTLNLDTTKVPTLAATSNTFTGSIAASAFSGNGANVTNVNAASLNGMLSSAFQPAGSYAVTTGANSFGGTQTISSGNLAVSSGNIALPQTTGSGVGVINLSGNPFIHACCSANNDNTFIGQGAGNFGFSSAFYWGNTATGYNALGLTTGYSNTSVGSNSLAKNVGGNYNTALGEEAGQTNTSGSNNTFLGQKADASTGTLSYATAIGSDAVVGASNALVLGGTGPYAVSVGIGTSTPQYTLDVQGTGNFTGAVTFAGGERVTGSVSTSSQLVSTVTTGTAPLQVSSTTQVPNLNASLLGGLPAAAFQPAGSYAVTTGANSFGGTQTISSGDLAVSNGDIDLSATTGATGGVIKLGGTPFMHDCCFSSGLQFSQPNFGGFTNTFIGLGAGNFSNPSIYNTATGLLALARTTGYSNTADGASSLANNYGGNYNTAVGQQAGQNNTSGSNNTFLGQNADASTGNLSNATAIGANAVVGASNALVLGGTGANAVSVGIGTSTPGYTLDVQGTGNFTGAVTFAGGESVTGSVSTSNQLVSTVATGTAPLQVSSTTQVPNLNASLLGGLPAAAFQPAGSYAVTTGANSFAGTQTVSSGDLAVSNGNIDLPFTTGFGVGVITMGGNAFIHSCCSVNNDNTFIGQFAGNFNSPGVNNTATGGGALASTTGYSNTADGQRSLANNAGGNYNTAVGQVAGLTNTTGSNNTFLGQAADASTGNLSNATAIGSDAIVGASNALVLGGTGANAVNVGIGTSTPGYTLDVRGTGNFTGAVTFAGGVTGNETINSGDLALPATSGSTVGVLTVGGQPFLHDSGGVTNTFVGASAGNFSGNGTNDTAMGQSTLAANSGSYNTAIGTKALGSNTTGGGNTAVGVLAGVTGTSGNANTTGNNNIFIGYLAGPGTSTQLNNATAIGTFATVGASNALVLGCTTANCINGATPPNVGIGQTTPYTTLHVRQDASSALGPIITLMNAAGGKGAGGAIEFDGYDPGPYNQPAAKIRSYDDANYSADIFFDTKIPGGMGNASATRMTITDVGNVGIGTVTPGALLEVNGTSQFDNTASFLGSATLTGSLNPDSGSTNTGTLNPGITFGTSSGEGISSERTSGANQYGLDFYTASNPRMSITQAGFVGIGTQAPGVPLEVIASNNEGGVEIANTCGGGGDCPTLLLENNSTNGNQYTVLDVHGVGAAECYINMTGDLVCTGSKSAVVPVDNGARQVALYAVEAPENWFEDAGSGQLSNGSSVVALEPTFAQTVNPGVEYHVFLTPEGDCEGLYVTHKTATGFEVHELRGGHSSIAFDYRIMARRKGYESIRLADKTKFIESAKRKRLSAARFAAPDGPAEPAPSADSEVQQPGASSPAAKLQR